MAFEQPSDPECTEVDIPDPVIDFLQSDILADTDDLDVDPMPVPSNAAIGADVAHLEVVGIFERGALVRHRSWGSSIQGIRSLLVEGFMWAVMIKLLSEMIELALLRRKVGRWRSRGFRFQSPVHLLMTAVLLWLARLDKFRQHAQADPPGREAGESGQGVGGERHAVIGADPFGQAEFLEQAGKHGLGQVHPRGQQALTGEQVAGIAVGDREGIAIDAVAGAEVSFEVRTPGIVRRQHGGRRFAGMADATTLAPFRNHAGATQDVAHRRASREVPAAVDFVYERQQLFSRPRKGGAGALPGTPPRFRPVSDSVTDVVGATVCSIPPAHDADTGLSICRRSCG